MGWNDIECAGTIDVQGFFCPREKVNDQKNPCPSPYLFDADANGFPLLTDKNITLIDTLFANDTRYHSIGDYEGEMQAIFKGMFDVQNSGYVLTKDPWENIKLAVYRTNADNSTSLPALSNADKNSSKPKQKDIEKRLGIIGGEPCVQSKEGSKKDNEKLGKLTGGSLLTARVIACSMGIENGVVREEALRKAYKERLLGGDSLLVYDIAHAAENAAKPYFPVSRNNFSFATKFCHHAWRMVNDDENKSNPYCIYDKYIGLYLPYYASEYLEPKELGDYCSDIIGDEWEQVDKRVDRYKIAFGKIDSFAGKNSHGEKKDKAGVGYGRYRMLYRATLAGINNWRLAHPELCPTYGNLDFGRLDRFIWYYFKNPLRNKQSKDRLGDYRKRKQ